MTSRPLSPGGRRRGLRTGEGNVGCILWVLVLAIIGLICFKVIPVKIANAELLDYIETTSQHASKKETGEILRKRFLKKAAELELPVEKDDISVKKTNDAVRVELNYTIPLEFPGYTYEMTVDKTIEKTIFRF